MTLHAVITAGGTSEPIDDVRVITNLSTGRFGAAIAHALVARGVRVTLLAGKRLASHPEWIPEGVEVVPFGSFAELDAALSGATATPPDLLFMCAAVSDYSPVPTAGKLRSDADGITITMRRNPKLLAGLRARCGVETFLVGFKLLSGVTRDELVAVAHKQVRGARLNLCLANDLAHLKDGRHPAVLVTPEGGSREVDGTKQQTAVQLVDFCLKRHQVRWHRTTRVGPVPAPDEAHAAAATLLATVQDMGLLPSTDGNVSHRGASGLWTTPRQVPKGQVKPADLVHADVDMLRREVHFRGARKPSIDTAVHHHLYAHLPALRGLIHVHEALVFPHATTDFPWPCGTVEEAEHIRDVLARAAWSRQWDGGDFAVRLAGHGWLLGFGAGRAARFADQWRAAKSAWLDHLSDIGVHDWIPRARPEPILEGTEIVGVLGRFSDSAHASPFLLPSARGRQLGDRITERLTGAKQRVIANDACEVVDWYVERGFRVTDRDGAVVFLEPASLRDDLVEAASVCLVDPIRQKVLIGRRLLPPWKDYWAFPGGRLEPGESLRDCALRELLEETGIHAAVTTPLQQTRVFVSSGAGERAFAVTNFAFLCLDAPRPHPSEELDATWVDFHEVAACRPMAAGTRRVLRKLFATVRPTQ